MRWETRNKTNHKKVAQTEVREGKRREAKAAWQAFPSTFICSTCYALRQQRPQTHTHTHTHTHTWADLYGAHTQYFVASFAANTELFQRRRRRQRSAFGMRCGTRALLGNVSRVCAVSFALGIYHVWQPWQTPGPAWPALAWPGLACPELLTDLSCHSSNSPFSTHLARFVAETPSLHLAKLSSCICTGNQLTRWPAARSGLMYLARFTTATETLKVYLLFMINCGLQACQTVRSRPPNRLNQEQRRELWLRARGGEEKGPERDFQQFQDMTWVTYLAEHRTQSICRENKVLEKYVGTECVRWAVEIKRVKHSSYL